MSRFIDNVSAPNRSEVRQAFDATSIAASGTQNSAALDLAYARQVRPVIDAAGANVTVTAQTSVDGGATWHDLAAYAAGEVGAQAVVETPGVLVRLSAFNAGVGAETVTAALIAQT